MANRQVSRLKKKISDFYETGLKPELVPTTPLAATLLTSRSMLFTDHLTSFSCYVNTSSLSLGVEVSFPFSPGVHELRVA